MRDLQTHRMQRIKRIHLIGIGGAGMGGIAEVLHNMGYTVSGSDLISNAMTERLVQLGIRIHDSHHSDHVENVDVVVYSNAIAPDNLEMKGARTLRVPLVQRSEMLAELMRFRESIAVIGTHGKTTTTSLIAHVLAEGGVDPTYVIGGQFLGSGSHAKLGKSRYLVAEVDESDSCFRYVQPIVAVVTNIDADHLDSYDGDFSKLEQQFMTFLSQLPFYGLAILGIDDPVINRLLPEMKRPYLTYGLIAEADISARIIYQRKATSRFSVMNKNGSVAFETTLNMPGQHNVCNSLAAVAVAREIGIKDAITKDALASFPGIARRCQLWGEMNVDKKKALLIDDYAHHPAEISAIYQAILGGWPNRRLIAIFQPHRYSRTRDLFDEFCEVLSNFAVVILLSVYAAGEKEIVGADSHALARGIRLRGAAEPIVVDDPIAVVSLLPNVVSNRDVVLVLGAGSIGHLSAALYARFGRKKRSRQRTTKQ